MAIRFFCMLVLASVCSAADEKPYTPPSHKELKERLSKDPNFKEKMKGFKPPVGAKGDRTPHDTIKESAKENGKDFAKPDLGELKDKFKGLPEKMKDKNAGVPKIPPEKRPKKSLFGEGDKPDFMKMGKGGKGVDVPSMGDRPLRKDKKEIDSHMDKMHTWWCKENGYEKMETALCQQWFDRHEKREKGEKPAAPKDPKERPPMEDIQAMHDHYCVLEENTDTHPCQMWGSRPRKGEL